MNPKICLSLFAIAVGWTGAVQAADTPSSRTNVEYSISGPVTRVQMPSLPPRARQGNVFVGPGPNGMNGYWCSSEFRRTAAGGQDRMNLASDALKYQLAARIAELVGDGGAQRLAEKIQEIENASNTGDKIMLAFHGVVFGAMPIHELGDLSGELTVGSIAQLQMGQEVTLVSPKVCRTREQMEAIPVEALRVMRAVHAQLVGSTSNSTNGSSSSTTNSGQRPISQSPQTQQAQPGAQRQTR